MDFPYFNPWALVVSLKIKIFESLNPMNPSTSKSSLISTVLAFLLCSFSTQGSALQVDWVEIESSGVGVTAKAARKAAILSALRKYAGEYMAEEQIVDKGELTNSVLLSFTTQKSFETEDLEGYPQIDDSGNWVVMMKVRLVEREYQEMINYLHPKQYSGSITVEATGTAPSVPEAERIAIANGVRMIVGEHVASELKIENDLLLIDVVKSFTRSSNVKSKRVGRPEVEGENVKVTMSVTAELEPLFTMCRDGMTSATAIRGDVLAAEISLVRDNQKAQIKLLQSLLKDLPTKLLVARLIDREGNPITDGRPAAADLRPSLTKSPHKMVEVAFNVQTYFDYETYISRVVPSLDSVLSSICTSQRKFKINSGPPNSWWLSVGSNGRWTGTKERRTLFARAPFETSTAVQHIIESNVDPDKCAVYLLTFVRRSEIGVTRYTLPEGIIEGFSPILSPVVTSVRLNCLDAAGQTIWTDQTTSGLVRSKTKTTMVIPVRATTASPVSLSHIYELNGTVHLLILPCFYTTSINTSLNLSRDRINRFAWKMREATFENFSEVEIRATHFWGERRSEATLGWTMPSGQKIYPHSPEP